MHVGGWAGFQDGSIPLIEIHTQTVARWRQGPLDYSSDGNTAGLCVQCCRLVSVHKCIYEENASSSATNAASEFPTTEIESDHNFVATSTHDDRSSPATKAVC